MPLNNYQKQCYKWFGRIAESTVTDKMKDDLEQAHMDLRAGAYLSFVWVNTILTGISSAIVSLIFIFLLNLEIWMILAFLLIPGLSTIFVYFFLMSYPASKAKVVLKKLICIYPML